MEESIYANWVMPQQKHEACDYSPSMLLLCVDTQWACGGGAAEAGAAGKGWFGLKAQFGSKEGEYPIVAAPFYNLMGATGGILTGGGVASGSFACDNGSDSRCSTAMPIAAAQNVDVASAIVVRDVRCEVLEREEGVETEFSSAVSTADRSNLEVVGTNDNSVAVEMGTQQVQHGQEVASMLKEGDGVGGLSGSDCVAGDGECEDVEMVNIIMLISIVGAYNLLNMECIHQRRC